MAGAYGANTPPRLNSYGTWIAQIITGDAQVTGLTQPEKMASGITLFPNPAIDLFTLEFELNNPGSIIIDLYDASGHKIRTLLDDYLRSGKSSISFNKLMLVPGNYFVSISQRGQKLMTEKLSVQ